MNNYIFKINYGTSKYFENNIGDHYYCRSPTSTAKKIKDLIQKNEDQKKYLKKDLKHIGNLVLFNLLQHPNISINIICGNETDKRLDELYISISKQELF